MHKSIALVHNFYRSTAPSGENGVVELESNLLKQHGHNVHEFFRYSDNLTSIGMSGTILGALSNIWNLNAARDLTRMVKSKSPSIVHVHNTFPLISPSIFKNVRPYSPIVLTLHNYRLFCAGGLPFREEDVCLKCIESRSAKSALIHGCYRQSRIATLPLAASISLHRRLGTWNEHVDGFIVFSEFQRQMVVKAGLPEHKIHIKPNFFPGKPVVRDFNERTDTVVFVGRLSSEKGVDNLIRQWIVWGKSAPELRIIGDGPLASQLKSLASSNKDVPIRFMGHLNTDEVINEISSAKLLVIPSKCFEGFPLVIREAFAVGTPVAASSLGPLPSIISDGSSGVIFDVNLPMSILDRIKPLWASPEYLKSLSDGAHECYSTKYNEDVNYDKLIEIYDRSHFEWKRYI